MPVGGICSHWPPFSRMQVSQPVRQITEARFLMFPYRHIGIAKPNIDLQYILLTKNTWGVDFLGSNLFGEGRGPWHANNHDSRCANWRQQLVGCKWCRSQWSRWWGTTVFERLGFSILELVWDVFWIGPGYISYIVWLLTTCAVAACKRWTWIVLISNWSNDKRFVLESWSVLYSIASHVSRFKSIPSLT